MTAIIDNQINREYISLNSEKRLNEKALRGYQNRLAMQLNGKLGDDMMDVLNGKKKIQLTKKYKIKEFIKRILCHFN